MMGEFETEPVPGLPANLPAGESLLWQGAPDWKRLAVEAFHVRKAAAWFVVLGLLRLAEFPDDGSTTAALMLSIGSLTLVAFVAVGLLSLLAWLSARTTVYTITSKRVVMRFGVALPMAINLPFKRIEAAALRQAGSDEADIALALSAGEKPAYLSLWPHARAWQVARPQPTLRCIADGRHVAGILARAMSEQLRDSPLQAARPASGRMPQPAHLPAGAT